MEQKEKLQRQINALREELNAIIDAENDALDATFVGKCFKMRNSSSSPKSEDDSWWLYIKVMRADAGLYCLRFQVDCNGRIDIEPNAYMTANSLDDYTPITPTDLAAGWTQCVLAVSEAPFMEIKRQCVSREPGTQD